MQNGSFIFLGNTRDQASACFCFLLPKKFPESVARTVTKPHTHLTRFILSGLKCTTDFAYRPSERTETLSALRPRASGLIDRLKARSNCVWSLVLPFSQTMIALKFEQNADFRIRITGNPCKTAPSSFWVILEIKRQLAFACSCPKSFQESDIRTYKSSYASNSDYYEWV